MKRITKNQRFDIFSILNLYCIYFCFIAGVVESNNAQILHVKYVHVILSYLLRQFLNNVHRIRAYLLNIPLIILIIFLKMKTTGWELLRPPIKIWNCSSFTITYDLERILQHILKKIMIVFANIFGRIFQYETILFFTKGFV